jgi:hypothetical protein
MEDLSIQLDHLPDEILIYIFKKLYNHEVLYSLIGVNQRLDRIVHDKIFTRDLCLLRYCSYDDSIIPLPDSRIDRCCSKILPDIGHQIESLFLEQTSIERILHATNYPNLNNLGLCDVNYKVAISLFGLSYKFAMPPSDGKRFLFNFILEMNSSFENIINRKASYIDENIVK